MSSPTVAKSFGQWKILLIALDGSLSNELAPLFREMLPFSPVFELGNYPNRAALGELLEEQGPTICFVDVGSSRERGAAVLGDLAVLDPKLPVIALHGANDPDFILRTLRAGATEFLVRPFAPEDFIPVMERVVSLNRSKRPGLNGKVFCVIPAKGACGASTLACGLAFNCRRLSQKRVLLADLDPLTGTIAFQLKIRQVYSFLDALNRGATLDDDVWKGLVETIQGVDVLLSPESPVHGIDDIHEPRTLIEYARMNYDYVVADCGGAYGAWALELARSSDEILLVTTNELPALQGAQRAISYLERRNLDLSNLRVVLNRYRKEEGLTHELVEAALHTRVYHLIPSDPESVERALVEGKPIASNGLAGKAMGQLAEKFCGKVPVPESEKKRKSGLAGLFGFLSR
jgi:pilus assembly protein CpaE